MAKRQTIGELHAELQAVLARIAPALAKVAKRGATRIGARAVGAYMRDGTADPGARSTIRFTRGTKRHASRAVRTGQRFGPRPSKEGPLRILSGRLSRAVTGGKGRGAIERLDADPAGSVTLTKGVDLDVVAYARVHELGGKAGRGRSVTIPARPYLTPALTDEAPAIRREAEAAVVKLLRTGHAA